MNLFKGIKPTLLTVLFCLIVSPLWAQGLELSDQQEGQLAMQLEKAREQLELSDEQAVAVEEILRNSFTERLLIMDTYGINPEDPNFKRPDMDTLQDMRSDMGRLEKDTRMQLENHLNKKQMKAFKKMERKRKDQMRKRMMGRG